MKLISTLVITVVSSTFLAGVPLPTAAGAEPPSASAVVATKTPWASGLRAPYGIARDRGGNVYVAEYSGGQIAKFSAEGKPLGKIGFDLKSPAWIERVGDTLYVSERKANRLLTLDSRGRLNPVAAEVIEPLGLVAQPAKSNSNLLVVAHTTSRIWRLVGNTMEVVYSARTENNKRYGYRCIAVDHDGSILITDEVDGQILLLTPAGRLSVWATGLDDPTAVVVAPDGQIYVAEEGAGRVSRLNAEGVATVIADGLGQVRDIEFIDGRTFLASDRKSGVIWRVQLNAGAIAGGSGSVVAEANTKRAAQQGIK